MKNVTVLIGAGSIGLAIARRVSSGSHVLVADLKKENADAVSKTLEEAGFESSVEVVNVSKREDVERLAKTAQGIGKIKHLIHAAGVSPSQAPISDILHVDLYGTAYFGGHRKRNRSRRLRSRNRFSVRASLRCIV